MLTLTSIGCSPTFGCTKSSCWLFFLPHFFKRNFSLSWASPIPRILSLSSSWPYPVWLPQHQDEKFQQDLLPFPHFGTLPGRAPPAVFLAPFTLLRVPFSSLLQHFLCFFPHSFSFPLLSASFLHLHFSRHSPVRLPVVEESGRRMWKKVVLALLAAKLSRGKRNRNHH